LDASPHNVLELRARGTNDRPQREIKGRFYNVFKVKRRRKCRQLLGGSVVGGGERRSMGLERPLGFGGEKDRGGGCAPEKSTELSISWGVRQKNFSI